MGVEHFGGYHETVPFSGNRHVIVYMNDEPTSYPTHWHTPLEILMPVENGYTARIGNRTFHLEPSDILFVAPNVYHAYAAPAGGRRIFALIDMSAVSDVLGVRQMLSMINPSALFTASNSPLIHARLQRLLRELCDAYFEREKYLIPPPDGIFGLPEAPAAPVDLMEPVIYSKVMEMLVLAAQNYGTSDRPAPVSRERRQEYVNKMTMVCSYIDDHCTEDLSLDKVSGMMNFSKFHFSRLFREFTGESFYRYVNRKRIQYACQLLLTQGMTVTDTALASGYSNASSFIRMFKSVEGCTPGQYRDQAMAAAAGRPAPPYPETGRQRDPEAP